jgi:hypothetical protein
MVVEDNILTGCSKCRVASLLFQADWFNNRRIPDTAGYRYPPEAEKEYYIQMI